MIVNGIRSYKYDNVHLIYLCPARSIIQIINYNILFFYNSNSKEEILHCYEQMNVHIQYAIGIDLFKLMVAMKVIENNYPYRSKKD